MSKNTILGGPSSTSDAASAPADTDGSAANGSGTDGSAATGPEAGTAPPTLAELPGDTETAVHRSRLYALLALGLDRPGDDLDAALADDAFGDPLVASAVAIDEDVAAAAGRVAAEPTDRETLRSDWASLFGVEEGLTVSPYELTYLPGPLMTNVRKLADLRGFYEAFGMEVAASRNDRGDHICFLAEFAGYLAEREAMLRERGDVEGVSVVVDAQRSFLEDHLGRWYWRFADEVSRHDNDGFYPALADLLAALVEREVDRLDLDPDWVPDDPAVTEWNEDVFGDSGRGCGGCGADTEGIDGIPEDIPSGPPDPDAADGSVGGPADAAVDATGPLGSMEDLVDDVNAATGDGSDDTTE